MLDLWCKKCGASLVLITDVFHFKSGSKRTDYFLLHNQTLDIERKCEFSNIKIGIKFNK